MPIGKRDLAAQKADTMDGDHHPKTRNYLACKTHPHPDGQLREEAALGRMRAFALITGTANFLPPYINFDGWGGREPPSLSLVRPQW